MGVVSKVVQFGPLDPIKLVFPNSMLFCMVKLRAEVIAMAYPNAPVKLLLRTVPEKLTFLRYLSPNQLLGPTAMPILLKGFV